MRQNLNNNNNNAIIAFLTVSDVQRMLGIGRNNAYALVRRSDFPSIYVGNRIIVPLDHFQSWVERQATKKRGGGLNG